jgi:tetratricopeptide (TPR) repeat protein
MRGELTNALIRGMDAVKVERPTYRDWLDAAKEYARSNESFQIEGNFLSEPIFENATLRAETIRQIRLIDQAPLDDLIQSLQRLINQRDQQRDTYPRGRLNLGIAYAATGDLEKAADALDRAVALYSDPSIMGLEKARDPLADEWFQESRYHLGRVLYESKRDLGRAVNELERVVDRDPENARALYYYGQAVRAMVERETLSKAQEVLERYLTKGSPLGHEDEVREFLGSRKTAPKAVR